MEQFGSKGVLPDEPVYNVSRHTVLRPLIAADYPWICALHSDPRVAPRTRLRGATTTPEDTIRILTSGVTAQFVVVRRSNGARLGLLTLYKADFRANIAFFAATFSPSAQQLGWPLEATILFVEYVFRVFELRKLYVEAVQPNVDSFQHVIGTHFIEEGRLREYEMIDGEFVDVVFAAMSRSHWQDSRAAYLGAVGASSNDTQFNAV